MSASFEHSAMKSSFSLSSLRSVQAHPNGRVDQLERPYHSLTKKRKEPCREAWRRSWGSAASGGSAVDDLWPLLQHHYDYIMDNHLIDTCKEANGELSSHNPPALLTGMKTLGQSCGINRQWSLSQLISEFNELCQWLTRVQEEIYSSPENLSNRNLRMNRMSELVSIEPRRGKLIEQSSAIVERIPEAAAEVNWRVDHLNAKWEGVRLLLSPDQQNKGGDNTDTVDTTHELRCLRRWLHNMEGRLPPPSIAIARHRTYHQLMRKLQEHQVLQKDVECHGRIVSSVVRLCSGGDAAKALERRWHLLYLRAIEWQCHLEACLAKIDNQEFLTAVAASDSDDEPVLKQPRLCRRGSPKRQRTPTNNRKRAPSLDSRQSASEDEPECAVGGFNWQVSCSDYESDTSRCFVPSKMADERRVPNACEDIIDMTTDQTVPAGDDIDGIISANIQEKLCTPPTVIKRKKPVDSSKFNQTDRKSKHLATFYFKHHDTDSDRNMIDNDDKSQEESSEEEWTYVGGAKVGNEDSTDLMTSSVEIQCELPLDDKNKSNNNEMESSTPDLLKIERCKDIERLVIQAEVLVQKQAQEKMAKKKGRNFKPLMFDEDGKSVCRVKISRIKEWLNQSNEEKNDDNNQSAESYDASGEYTTESEVDNSLTSEERNLHSSMDMSTSTCTVTPTHHAKVQLRKKRVGGTGVRPWSVSCISQLNNTSALATPTSTDNVMTCHNMSISESALNTLTEQGMVQGDSDPKLRGSSTTVQGHVSSTNTMTEACTSCVEASDKQCWLRRKRLKLRRQNNHGILANSRRDRMVKSLSFCGRLTPEIEDKNERSTCSDPATSRKHRFDTTSTSGADSDDDMLKQQLATIANLRRSIEKTHITTQEDNTIVEQDNSVAPTFKLGPEGGPVRPRVTHSTERDKTYLAMSLGDPNRMWDLSVDRDSDVDKSGTAGTEEHSSFSEQAWDFYQEKYNSEPYSEAPDSDAARRILEFGDDYRAFFDSQSESSHSARRSPARRRPRPTEPARRMRRPLPSADRKKSLLDSLERARANAADGDNARRRRPSDTSRSSKRSPDLLDNRRNASGDEEPSSLEYGGNRPDILDSVTRRRWSRAELQKVALSEMRRQEGDRDSESDTSPRKPTRRRRGSDADGEVRATLRRSAAQLDAAEALLARADTEPDLLRSFDYTEIISRCRENINLLDAELVAGCLSQTLQRDLRAVSARWSALRAAASRRSSARRLRRELTALRETLDDVCEPADGSSQPHTRAQLNRRIEELKERLSRLLDCKVSLLKLTVSVRRAIPDGEPASADIAADLAALLRAWDDAHTSTSTELLSLEKAVNAWSEWENALRELQNALRGDLATLQALKKRGLKHEDHTEVAAQIKQLAESLMDKRKGSWTCDSLSDSGISDGDGSGGGARARRLGALRTLASELRQALAPHSPAAKAIAKKMEQTENEVRTLQESCKALVEKSIPDLKIDDLKDQAMSTVSTKTGSGDPDYNPRGGWLRRVLRSALPIQLCLVALLLAAWLVDRPRCCDSLNSLAQTLMPQLRYVRGPPPV